MPQQGGRLHQGGILQPEYLVPQGGDPSSCLSSSAPATVTGSPSAAAGEEEEDWGDMEKAKIDLAELPKGVQQDTMLSADLFGGDESKPAQGTLKEAASPPGSAAPAPAPDPVSAPAMDQIDSSVATAAQEIGSFAAPAAFG
ncbi:hypothetical protein CYMTET_32251 [Cymbomonas tetramitiformis]|uniref:Uncharacterized protein n=1 Tax=Cymbomonas tetramitiformis TaxID=36881 RepID=A0AAE0FFG1_9CHLO|nr:hypothetical protein CYMTET_32251 [Cymbomonas tetramitiformis]